MNIFVGWGQNRRNPQRFPSTEIRDRGILLETTLHYARLWTRKKTSLTHSKTSCTGIFRILSASAVQATKYWLDLRNCHRTLNSLNYSRTSEKCGPCFDELKDLRKTRG